MNAATLRSSTAQAWSAAHANATSSPSWSSIVCSAVEPSKSTKMPTDRKTGHRPARFDGIQTYAARRCKRNIEMAPLCKVEMTLSRVLGSRLRPRSRRNTCRRCRPISVQASATRGGGTARETSWGPTERASRYRFSAADADRDGRKRPFRCTSPHPLGGGDLGILPRKGRSRRKDLHGTTRAGWPRG